MKKTPNKVVTIIGLILVSPIAIVFGLCVLFLQGLGKLVGLTYTQISVVFNLWLQGAVLMLSGLAPFAALLYASWGQWSVLSVVELVTLLLYGAVYVVAFLLMLNHYFLFAKETLRIRVEAAYRLCATELDRGAAKIGISYMALNVLVFIVAYLGVLGANVFFSWHILAGM